MARPLRFCPPGYPVHIIHRGNNKNILFTCDTDIAAYAHWLAEAAQEHEVAIHAWVFMTNHVHLLMTPSTDRGISQLMHYVSGQHARCFNNRYARSGTLFEGRFKSSVVEGDSYLLRCLRYIELNPVRAGLVTDPGDYRWSSYRSHAFGLTVGMWTQHALYQALGVTPAERQVNYRALIGNALSVEAIAKIRHCANKGLALGTEDFRAQIEKMRR